MPSGGEARLATQGGRRFRPSLWATLITVPAVAAMLALGTWQLNRLQWKTALQERVAQSLTAPAVPLPASLDDPAAWEFRPVTLTGRFLHDKELRVVARPRQGQVGYEIVTPFERAGGPPILVNRGFVPMDRADPTARAGGQVAGAVTVAGTVRLPQEAGLFQPGNSPGASSWMRVDPPAMAAAVGLAEVAPVIVELSPGQSPGGLPAGVEQHVELPNNHLQYAFTWYSFGATLAVIYVLSQRRRKESTP
ncbi:SURF1 family protein [Azospirillum sp. SYSU D00513]|uniref:SURF1 family protein n=1 Tax=Azospirillum sp. SYSU D00513 TaxID=2812561 RepID=UPI001A96C453|nr:SURF1 family protein [Azospirillum sp. SYSU D00513]